VVVQGNAINSMAVDDDGAKEEEEEQECLFVTAAAIYPYMYIYAGFTGKQQWHHEGTVLFVMVIYYTE
jgi:hypothetical protein